MKVIELRNNDICLDVNKQISIINGISAERQLIKNYLLTLLGECPLNQNIGIAYDNIIGEKLNSSLIMEYVKENLEALEFIERIEFDDFNVKNRLLSFKCIVTNKNGDKYDVDNN